MLNKISRWFSAFLLMGTLLLAGCSPDTTTSSTPTNAATGTPPATESSSTVMTTQPSVAQAAGLPRLEGKATVVMVIKDAAPITIEIDGTDAPITAGNFVDLVKQGVYNNSVFHRVVREPQPFVVQGGDPQSKDPNVPSELFGTGSFIDPTTKQPRYIPLEIKPEGSEQPIYGQVFRDAGVTTKPKLKHTRGAVAMARSADPDSASAQFYFALADLDFLDGNYAVFGKVIEGMETVDKIKQGDRLQSAEVTKGLENLKVAGKS